MSAIRAVAWLLVTPALALDAALLRCCLWPPWSSSSLQDHAQGGWTVANYRQFFTNPDYFQAMVNSLR